jgi:hypothetical protein
VRRQSGIGPQCRHCWCMCTAPLRSVCALPPSPWPALRTCGGGTMCCCCPEVRCRVVLFRCELRVEGGT